MPLIGVSGLAGYDHSVFDAFLELGRYGEK